VSARGWRADSPASQTSTTRAPPLGQRKPRVLRMAPHRYDHVGREDRGPRLRPVRVQKRQDREEGLLPEDRRGVASQTADRLRTGYSRRAPLAPTSRRSGLVRAPAGCRTAGARRHTISVLASAASVASSCGPSDPSSSTSSTGAARLLLVHRLTVDRRDGREQAKGAAPCSVPAAEAPTLRCVESGHADRPR
jgi:hypothetical protein